MRQQTQAAVLVPVYRDPATGLRLVVIRRVDAGVHAGQISFPGGKREPSDGSLVDTAIRETAEEIGVGRGDVEIVASLPVVRTLTSRFDIHPFLGRIRPPGTWRPQEREVAEVIEIGLGELARPGARVLESVHPPTATAPLTVPCFRVADTLIWGATYRILDPLVARLTASEWDL